MKKRRICFATFELAPFTGGGIGTWLANTLHAYKDRPTQFEVLFCAGVTPDAEAFARIYPDVVLHSIALDDPDESLLRGRVLSRKDMASIAQWRSYLLMCALENLERTTGRFDVIEFVDWCGAAYFSLNAKRLGRSFQDTVLAVRLHAAESVLRDYETRGWSAENLIIADLERQALLDADVKVAHLASTADVFRDHFRFPQSWRDDFHIELPPVSVAAKAARTNPINPRTPIVFTSKIQSFKRPEVFARGVSRFVSHHPEYQGEVHFLAFDVEPALRLRCEQAFPREISERVIFGGLKSAAEREERIRGSVAVFPGAFEAFGFAPYEASMAGATVLLNARNAGFGDGSPWKDGVNCLKFDGTANGLFRTLERLFSDPALVESLAPITLDHAPVPYWERVEAAAPDAQADGKLTVIVPHRYEGGLLYSTIDSVLSDRAEPEQLVVVSEASGEPSADLVLDSLEVLAREMPERIDLVCWKGHPNVGELLLQGLELAREDVIAVVPAGFEVLPGFLEDAVRALSANPDHSAVLPTIRVVSEHDAFRTAQYWLPLGASMHYGLFSNRMTAGCVVARRALFQEFPPNHLLTAEWMWDVLLRASYAGHRFIVADKPSIQAFNRVLFDQATHDEWQRRETLETIRRHLAVEGSAGRIGLGYLGDGELLSSISSLAPHQLAQASAEIEHLRRQVEAARLGVDGDSHENWRERALYAEDQLRMLSDATTVKLALRTARMVENATPWLKRPIRAALRRR
jgi:hypothetical protein